MKIVFVTKNFLIEPLGIMYLISALKYAGHKPDIIQTEFENINIYLKENKPDIVAYSLTTGMHKYFLDLNKKLKKRYKFISLFGGPHVTFFADELMVDNCVDIACLGEGEEAIVELANAIENKKNITKINNLWIRKNGRIYKNEVRNLQRLDDIKFPDREIIYQKYPTNRLSSIKNIIATRGCPFNCPYCYNHLIKKIYAGKGTYIRQRSVENVIAEMKEIKNNYPVKIFYFQDDIFAIHKEWLAEFAKRYPQEVGVPFHCHLRVTLTDRKVIQLLRKAGCSGVSLAIEAGNDEIRNKILGRQMSKKEILNVTKELRKAKLKFRIFNMIGLPGGNIKTDIETLKLNIKCRPTLGWASIYQPYPKTELYQTAKTLGLCDEISLDQFDDFFSDSILNIPDKKKLQNLQKLFSFITSWPIFIPFINLLISLPLEKIYAKIHNYWKNRCNNKIYHVTS